MAFIQPIFDNPSVLVTILISLAFNIMFLALAFIEPYKSIFEHMLKTWTHQNGKKLNAFMFTKSGALLNVYGDIEQDGTFKYRDNKYLVNKQAFFNYKGLPTQLYKENVMEPVDPFNRPEVRELTTIEGNTVMASNQDPYDILQTLKKYALYAAFAVVGLIGVLGALAYLQYEVFDVIVQSGQQAAEIVNQARGGTN